MIVTYWSLGVSDQTKEVAEMLQLSLEYGSKINLCQCSAQKVD